MNRVIDYSKPKLEITDAEIHEMMADPNRRQVTVSLWGPKPWPERGTLIEGQKGDHAVLTVYIKDGERWRLEGR